MGKHKRSSRIPIHPRGLLRPFSCFVLSIARKSKGSISEVAKTPVETRVSPRADDQQPHGRKLPGCREKDVAASELKESLMRLRRESSRLKTTRERRKRRKTRMMKKEDKDDEEDEEGR